MAIQLRRSNKLELASEAIKKALSRARQDLYCQEVAVDIYSTIDKNVPSQDVIADYLASKFCAEPFKTLELTPQGDAFVCCPDWLPVSIGNINEDAASELWHSGAAQALRESIVDRSFRYCSKTNCALIAGRTLPPADSKSATEAVAAFSANKAGSPESTPTHLILSHDRSCNLSCPSCRNDLFLANKTEQARLDVIAENVILPLLKHAHSVKITGSGDPFGSNHFRNIIKRINRRDFPELAIDLHTNGQLFDERAWSDLEMEGTVAYTQISIDAARSDTYKIVRRGGDFGRLTKNLAFIRSLRRRGQISRLDFSFVVQTRNFREMPEFANLAEEFGADCVSFSMIRNWGTFQADEYAAEFIGSSSHADHREFLEVLRNPALSKEFVFLGNLSDYVQG